MTRGDLEHTDPLKKLRDRSRWRPGISEAQPATVLVAEDHPAVRAGLRDLFRAQPDLVVVAEAGDIASVLAHTHAHRPRVLVLDLHMGGRLTLPWISALRAASPQTAIVVATMEGSVAFVDAAERAGAAAYLRKDADRTALVAAVRGALEECGRTRPGAAPVAAEL